jgi:hypothetical protein
MADTHEADRPNLTVGDAVRELFAQLPAPGKDIVWLADQVISIVQHLGSIELERMPEGESHALVCRTDTAQLVIVGSTPLRLFRPLLARLAVLGGDETGGDPQLYGGRYALVRSSRTGPVRLEVTFTNTASSQRVTITRVPTGIAPRTDSAPGADSANPTPQPSA